MKAVQIVTVKTAKTFDMDIKKQFGKKIKEKRSGLDLTQEEPAERAGISAKSLSRIELGNNFVSAENFDAVSRALNVQPKVLFDFNELNDEQMVEFVNSKIINNKNLLCKVYKMTAVIE